MCRLEGLGFRALGVQGDSARGAQVAGQPILFQKIQRASDSASLLSSPASHWAGFVVFLPCLYQKEAPRAVL